MTTYRELAEEFLRYTKTDRYHIKNLKRIPYDFYLQPENRELLKDTIKGILRYRFLGYVSWDYKAYFLEIVKILILKDDEDALGIVSLLKKQYDFNELFTISRELIARDNAEVFKLLFRGSDYNPCMKALFQVFCLSRAGSRIMELVLSHDNPLGMYTAMKEQLVKHIAYQHLPLLSGIDEEFQSLVRERAKLELEIEKQTLKEYAALLDKISILKQCSSSI
jgi:hypothetical protein